MSHTPGPWRSVDLRHQKNGQIRIIGKNWDLANVLASGPHPMEDASLIEAAPDLLSACERLLVNFHHVLRGDSVRDAGETIAEAEAALRKAGWEL